MLGHVDGTDAQNFASAGRVNTKDINLYVPHFTPNILQQILMIERIVFRAPTYLPCNKT